jgi:hypothetical protein
MASILSKDILPATEVSANFDSNTDENDDGKVGKKEMLLGDINFIGLIKVTNATAVKEITSIVTRADVSDDLDGTYFILQDDVGSVAFWFDVDNSGTTIPAGASAADRAVEITTITTDMAIGSVGTAVYTAIIADSKFEAGSDDTAGTILVQASTVGIKTDGADGDAGFTITEDTAGKDTVSFAAKIQHSHNGEDWVDLLSFSTVAADVVEEVHLDNTTTHVMSFVKAVLTRTSGIATFAVDLLHDRRRG